MKFCLFQYKTKTILGVKNRKKILFSDSGIIWVQTRFNWDITQTLRVHPMPCKVVHFHVRKSPSQSEQTSNFSLLIWLAGSTLRKPVQISLQFCSGFEKLSAGRDALQLCRAAIADDPITGKTTQYVRLYGQLGDRLIDYATVFSTFWP